MIATGAIGAAFAGAHARGRAALVPYVVAGDPDVETTLAVLETLTAGGADFIELGIPYGDPLADGPTIAAAGQRALAAGTRLAGVLTLAAEARRRGVAPLVFFTYVNPIDRYGAERFAREAREAGVAGTLVPDVPLEELDAFAPPLRAAGLEIPLMVAPTTPPARIPRIAAASTGFVYVVSRLGVTGARREPDLDAAAATVGVIRPATALPVAVGFGIASAAHVRRAAAFADGVIVGSALVDSYAGTRGTEAARRVAAFFGPLAEATLR